MPALEVRNWANLNGFSLKTGPGRLPMAAVKAFNAAHESDKRQYVLGGASAANTPRKFDYTTATGRKGKTVATTHGTMREWAIENDVPVSVRGRVSQDVIDAYGQAHAPARKGRKSA